MKYLEVLAWTLFAVMIAVLLERLVSHFCRRADDDTSRLDAAIEAMQDQQESLEALLARETVPEIVKDTLLMFAEAALSKRAAHALFRIVTSANHQAREVPADVKDKLADFNSAIELMQRRDPEAYELYRTFIYRVPIMAFLQHQETYKAMGQLSLRLAEEREPAAARDAALMTRESHLLPAAA
ncbi:hypothetical protein BF49_3577 [Bradyrhizobium sp.]|uniref:hypothetical protein n=1 Tax=Bradyrhizobium sp. TaxID=376 RepID=UPI0007C1F432|nr:hypothetical protein [Bradyrhizobium sp.]CUT12497.1 hypothetical protein BF49_3577 [Bradyrhizobium sp.]